MEPNKLSCPICDSTDVEAVAELYRCSECGEYFDDSDTPTFEAYGRHKTRLPKQYDRDE